MGNKTRSKFLKAGAGTVAIILSLSLCGCANFDEENKTVPEEYRMEWNESLELDTDYFPSVIKPAGRDLKILQVTDVHYDQNNDKKEETLEMLRAVVERNAPDLVVMTGDWTSERTETEARARAVFDTIEGCGVPWAPVFGNHDREGVLDSYDYAEIFKSYPNCLFRAGYSNLKGAGNYIVTVREGAADGKIVSALTLFDSHTSVKTGVEKYMPLGKNQVAFYRWAIDKLNGLYQGEGVIPTLAFLHIPLNEYVTAYKKALNSPRHLIGSNQEKICAPEKNAGLFAAMTEKKSTKAVFAGHDHGNTSASLYKGIVLSYGVETGWCKDYRTEQQKGASVITLKDDGQVFITHDYCVMAW